MRIMAGISSAFRKKKKNERINQHLPRDTKSLESSYDWGCSISGVRAFCYREERWICTQRAVSSFLLSCEMVLKYLEHVSAACAFLLFLWTTGPSPRSPLSLCRFVFTRSDQKKIYIGDDNPLTLIVKAQNQGEGAYEAELIVSIPPQADFIGVVRNSEVSRLPL